MVFEISLIISLIIFGLGIAYKFAGWFRHGLGYESAPATSSQRFSKTFRSLSETLLSRKFFTLLKAFLLDALLQTRTMREDRFRWVMHLLIYGGFTVLLLMHALGNILTIHLFSEYYPTVNPFLFLRDFMGILVLCGLIMAVYRRLVLRKRYVRSHAMDYYAIGILALIFLSGFLLEGIKITSHNVFSRMVEDYAGLDEGPEFKALESFWVNDYGVVSPKLRPPFDPETLTLGRELHEENCAACHAPQKWAFAGFTVGKIVSPLALTLDRLNAVTVLWYIHIMASFFGLAYLPFSKMFHIIASPINLLAGAVSGPARSHPTDLLTRQMLELDACTHCGACSYRCSAAIAFQNVHNINILPSERMISLKKLVKGKRLREADVRAVQEGIYLCTNCDRCTVVCPVGINLKELWFDVREALIQKGFAEPLVLSPYSFYRGLNRDRIDPDLYSAPLETAIKAVSREPGTVMERESIVELTDAGAAFRDEVVQFSTEASFSYCFGCENCSTVCPVVANYEDPVEMLGLLPHQIMRSVGLGIKEMALGSMMLWHCTTCYQCQEHCPQEVHVTDILFTLKNQAIGHARTSGLKAHTGAGGNGGRRESL